MMEDLERKVSFKGDKDDKGEGEENGNSHNRSENPPPSPPPANIRSSSPNVRGSVAKSPNFQARSLRENLMREQRDRDPLFYYEVIQTLGVGSMGSVAKVKKRAHLVGGSARASIQQAVRRQKKERECLKIPIIGGIFRFCLDGKLKESRSLLDLVSVGKGQSRNRLDTGNSTTSSILQINAPDFFTTGSASTDDSIRSLGSSTGKSSIISSTSNTYAMKSIHLSRVTEDSFITELKNEIDILKKLDHPHIVRAIETFEHRNQIFIVMELCQGGDLYSRDPYTEEDAARIVSSVLSAIAYMHSKGITHRDRT
jgi:serine/threonine protein kinase